MGFKDDFKAVFFDRSVIWLFPNELALGQMRRFFLSPQSQPGLKPRLLSFGQLESLLLAELGPPELDPLARRLLLSCLSEKVAPQLGLASSETEGPDLSFLSRLADNLGDAFDRLRLAGLSWAELEKLPPAELTSQLAALGRDYDRLLAQAGRSDRFILRRRLLDLLARGHCFQTLEGVTSLVCRWSQRLSPFETDFLLALANGPRRVELCLSVPDWLLGPEAEPGGSELLRAIKRLETLGSDNLDLFFALAEDSSAPPPLSYAAKYLLAPPSLSRPPAPPLDGRLELREAPNAYHEVEAAAREIKALLAQGRDPETLALVLPDLERYGPLVDDVGRRFGLAFQFRRGETLADKGPVRAVLELLALWTSHWERTRLLKLLRSPYFQLTSASPAELARLALRLGISDDRAGGGFAVNLEKSAQSRLTVELERLLKKLKKSGHQLAQAKTWPEFIKKFKEILNKFLWPGDLSPAADPLVDRAKSADLAAAFAFRQELERLSEALAVSPLRPPVTLTVFSHWLRKITRERYISYDRNPAGRVRVLNYYDLHGGRFAELFFLGLNERLFPKPQASPCWWPREFSRQAAKALGRPLWNEPADEYRQQEFLLAQALSQAEERVWLFYHSADETGQAALPSPLLAALRAMWPAAEGGSQLRPCRLPWLAPATFELAAGPDELWPALMAQEPAAWPQELRSASWLELRERLKARLEKWRAADLVRPGPEHLGRWLKRRFSGGQDDQIVWKPSDLADFALCPLSFWYKLCLGLRADDEPLELWSPQAQGSWVHLVLEKFFQSRRPALWPERENTAAARELFKSILDDETAALSQSASLGRRPLWELKVARLRAELELWLENQLSSSEEFSRPLELEWSFRDETAWELEINPQESIFFQGRVDRLDELAGGRLRVLDYKLKDYSKYRLCPPEPHPRAWPLLIYSLAASAHFKKPVENRLEILDPWVKTKRQGCASDHEFMSAPASAAQGPGFQKILAETWARLKEGSFPATPEAEHCRFCSFGLLCPAVNDYEWEAEHEPL